MDLEEIFQFVEWTPNNIRQSENIESKEKRALEICVKLLLHITLISIFETLFYFLYIASLENNGIEWTINAFINGAVNECQLMNATQVQQMNHILDKYINASNIIRIGNLQESFRILYNTTISLRAWMYISILSGLFSIVTVYIKCRRIKMNWTYIILENTSMVLLLGLYEFLFFDTIIYPYQPISTDEIERNMIQQLQNGCGLLKN
jgi:hypothetical protein